MRNRECRAYMFASIIVVICATVCTYYWLDEISAVVVLGVGLSLIVLALLCLYSIHRNVQYVAQEIDRALFEGRQLKFASMREGDLSYLASQIDKTLNQLTLAHNEVQQHNERLADYLADISHQIRTPLTSLALELELLKSDACNPTMQARLLEAESMVERIQWLISTLLKLSRLDAGAVQFASQQVDVARLAASAFEPLAHAFEQDGIEFECHIAPQVSFEGDSSWTREALTNILKNALEHTPTGSKVTLRATEDALATRIVIQDEGAGIDPKDLPHIFERFYRAQSALNPKGVGVGLALAQALVTAQGGAIKASNVYTVQGTRSGARFEIIFFKAIVRINMEQPSLSDLIHELLYFGKAMTLCGTDVRFVETTLEKLGKHYGAEQVHVFVISSAIMITITKKDLQETQSVCITTKIGYDFSKMQALNRLATAALDHHIELKDFTDQRQCIDAGTQQAAIAYVGSALAAGGFAIFFGGMPLDGLVAAAVGLLFCALTRTVRLYCPNDIVFNALACFISGLAIAGAHKLIPHIMVDMVTIGVIMLPIPGIPLTNAVRDMLSGDIITGILRFVESLLITAGIAAGFIAAMALAGA